VAGGFVIVEFFAVPRMRAGRAQLEVRAGPAIAVLQEVVAKCPGLSDLLTPAGRLSPHYLLSLEGEEFLTDLSRELSPGSRLLLLSADAGG